MPIPMSHQPPVTLSMGDHDLDSIDMLTFPQLRPTVQTRTDAQTVDGEAGKTSTGGGTFEAS